MVVNTYDSRGEFMNKLILLTAFSLFGLFAFAGNPPANYPAVNGLVKKIDLPNKQITLKHETIPNLNMPGMTMPFLVEDIQILMDIQVGDQIRFSADENTDGDLVLIWIEKSQQAPPNNLPQVNGVIKKIDVANHQITLKHDAIPNLNMPGMTMPFIIQDPQMINGLKVGDLVKFSADQNPDGDLVIVWIGKSQQTPITDATPVLCTGVAKTSPKTNIEVDIRQDKFSTIRYEYAEGSYKGTAYINSIGRMVLKKNGDRFLYQAGDGNLDSKLRFEKVGSQIQNAKFYSFSAGMNFDPVQCSFQN
jgi:Cu/Ag efflux protein CusF